MGEAAFNADIHAIIIGDFKEDTFDESLGFGAIQALQNLHDVGVVGVGGEVDDRAGDRVNGVLHRTDLALLRVDAVGAGSAAGAAAGTAAAAKAAATATPATAATAASTATATAAARQHRHAQREGDQGGEAKGEGTGEQTPGVSRCFGFRHHRIICLSRIGRIGRIGLMGRMGRMGWINGHGFKINAMNCCRRRSCCCC
jgi:hypothetical protein